MRSGHHHTTNSVLVGASIVVAIVVAVFLSYNANRGLPFVRTFPLTVEVPDAAELVSGSEVRIGGFRVGQVRSIAALPPRGKTPPLARIELALDGSVQGIPSDTTVRIRPRSLLGAKYVELTPGSSPRMLAAGARLPVAQARATPELDETFDIFDPATRRALQSTIRSAGDALAGRGGDVNRTIEAVAAAQPPLERVLATLTDPATDLHGFVDGVARLSGTLAPVAPALGALADAGAATLAAVDRAGAAVEGTLTELPPTEEIGTRALRAATPVLGDLADLAHGLRPAARRLPQAGARLAAALRAGTPVLRRAGELTEPLDRTLAALGRLASDPAAGGAVGQLTTALTSLLPTLRYLVPAQTVCNVAGLWTRNVSQTVSEGDLAGSWISFIVIGRLDQMLHAATPDPDLHYTTYPNENASECEAGNEPYSPGRAIGNPAGLQPASTERTAPPPGVLDRARAAGLLDRIPGARG